MHQVSRPLITMALAALSCAALLPGVASAESLSALQGSTDSKSGALKTGAPKSHGHKQTKSAKKPGTKGARAKPPVKSMGAMGRGTKANATNDGAIGSGGKASARSSAVIGSGDKSAAKPMSPDPAAQGSSPPK
jgi:hypothetical protein